MAVFSGFRPFLNKGSTVNGVQNMFFSDGTNGFHYLPSLTDARNFSNAATFGQRVHSLQDLKLGAQTLGPELVTNGTFDSGTTGWSATGGSTNSVVDGKLNVIAAGASNGSFTVMTGLKIGSTYRILATINRNSATNVHVSVSASGSTEPRVYTYQSASDVGDVNIESYFVATATSHRIHVGRDCIGTSIYDNISVREVLNAAYALQASTSLTPLLGRSPRSRRNNISDSVSTPSVVNGTLSVGSPITDGNASIPMWDFTIGATALPTISGVSRERPNSASVGFNYMHSVFVKPGTNRYIYFSSNFGGVQNNVGSKFRYDTVTDTITSIYSGNVTDIYRGVQNLGDGIYRLFIRQRQGTNSGSKTVGVYCSSTSETTGANSYITPTVAPTGVFSVGGWQSEIVDVTSTSPSNYQVVSSTVEIDESNVVSYPFIRLDLSDDVLTTTNLVSRRNLFRFTEEFDNAAWSKINCSVTANVEIAPDGTLSAEKVIENTTNVERNVRQTINVVSGLQYTASCYFKAAERTFARIACFGNVSGAVGGGVGAGFNLSTGTAASDSGAPNATSIQNVGNGWYRCRITVTASATGTITFNLGPSLAINTFNYLGDGVSGGFIWGAQVEVGGTLTDYDYGGTKGTIVVAGKDGTAIENVYLPDGNFSLGPTGYTGGTPGILRAVGDIVGYTLTGRNTSTVEQDQLIDFYKFRGAKGRLIQGPNLVQNGDFSNGLTGWSTTSTTGTFEVTNNVLRITATQNTSFPTVGIDVPYTLTRYHLFKFTIPATLYSGYPPVYVSASHGGGTGFSVGYYGVGTHSLVSYASPFYSAFLRIGIGISRLAGAPQIGDWGEITNIELYELRPEEEW